MHGQPASVVVTGMNSMNMLEKDTKLAESYKPITKNEIDIIQKLKNVDYKLKPKY